MAKINAVVLFNGTSNDDKDQALTNIVKMRDGLVNDDKQFVIYKDGVGNDQQWSWLTRWFSLFTGYGAGWVMDQAYQDLNQQIEKLQLKPGDTLNVSLGGFSRGAAIARHFGADYIEKRLRQDHKGKFKIQLDSEYLFDTVGAFGIPFNFAWLERIKIYTQEIDWGYIFDIPLLTHAFHAISLDEKREGYTPKPLTHRSKKSSHHGKREEVYFAGDHSTVGGGHHKPGQILADNHPLRYMAKCAIEQGLRFTEAFINGNGLAEFNKKFELGDIVETDTKYWPKTQIEDRELRHIVDDEMVSITKPRLHTTLYRRMKADNDYRPANLNAIKDVEVLKEDGTTKERSLAQFRS